MSTISAATASERLARERSIVDKLLPDGPGAVAGLSTGTRR